MLSRRVFSPSLYFCVKKHPPVVLQSNAAARLVSRECVAGFRLVTPQQGYWRENYCTCPSLSKVSDSPEEHVTLSLRICSLHFSRWRLQ